MSGRSKFSTGQVHRHTLGLTADIGRVVRPQIGVRSFRCPSCDAAPGDGCVTASDAPMKGHHGGRTRLATRELNRRREQAAPVSVPVAVWARGTQRHAVLDGATYCGIPMPQAHIAAKNGNIKVRTWGDVGCGKCRDTSSRDQP